MMSVGRKRKRWLQLSRSLMKPRQKLSTALSSILPLSLHNCSAALPTLCLASLRCVSHSHPASLRGSHRNHHHNPCLFSGPLFTLPTFPLLVLGGERLTCARHAKTNLSRQGQLARPPSLSFMQNLILPFCPEPVPPCLEASRFVFPSMCVVGPVNPGTKPIPCGKPRIVTGVISHCFVPLAWSHTYMGRTQVEGRSMYISVQPDEADSMGH